MTTWGGLMFLLTFKLAPSSGLNFTKLEHPIGAFISKTHDTYISYNNWKLLYYYDLKTLYENIDTYGRSLQLMEDACHKMTEFYRCEAIILKHKEQYSEINNDIDYIKMIQDEKITHARQRRAPLGFMSKYIYKPIFGFMDEEDAELFSSKINSLINNQQTHSIILENHMSIVKQFIRITNRTMEQFENNIEILNTYINNFTSTAMHIEKEIKQHINFEYISDMTSLISRDHHRMAKVIKDALKNTLQGDYTKLISHERLRMDLVDVAQNIDESIFMVVEKLKHIQQIISIKAIIKEKRLLVEIDVPILNKNVHKMHKIIPLPIKYLDKIIIFNLKNQIFLVDNETRTYIFIDQIDLQYCKPVFSSALLCFPQTEMYFENQNTCESNILFEEDIQTTLKSCEYKHLSNITYIKRLTDNSYFITTPTDFLIRENCFKEASIFHTIKSTGILKINANCEIITSGMKIFTRNIKTKNSISDITLLHKFTNISIFNASMIELHLQGLKPTKLKYLDINDEFSKLINDTDIEISRLHTVEMIGHIEYNITKKYTIYTIVAIIVYITARILYKKCC